MSDLTTAILQLTDQVSLYQVFDNYYAGVHSLNYASDKFRVKFGKRLQNLKENLCKTVVKVPADRLEVIGFGADKKQIGDQAWQIWKRNKMPLHSKELHRMALTRGDAFALVWSDPKQENKAKIFVQDNTVECATWKDPETGEIRLGAKGWRGADKKFYLTLYYPDRVEKYISKNEMAEGSTLQDTDMDKRIIDGEEWGFENPFASQRVPLIHFTAGESVLLDVVPLNDGLNKSLADTFVGAEYNSIRQRYTAGISYPINEETGKAMVPFEHDDQYVTTSNADAKIGEFSDMDLKSNIENSNDMRLAIARVSGIPVHYFMLTKGDFPSGEAQEKAEARLISLVTDCQLSFGESWSTVMSLCMELESAAGAPLEIETQWRAASPPDEKRELEKGTMKAQLGWSNRKIQEDAGVPVAEIRKMAKEIKQQGSALGEALGVAFDRGEAVTDE